MNLREKAQKRVRKWKSQFKTGWDISQLTGVREDVISRIFTGKGPVSEKAINEILEAKEVVK